MAKSAVPVLNFDKDIAKFTERQLQVCGVIDNKLGKYILYGGCLGGGKLLRLSTPIATPDGWTNIGDIKVGDRVFDEEGFPCNVIAVSEPQKDRTYLITFSDGSEIVAGANHEWVTETNDDRKKNLRYSEKFRSERRSKRPLRGKGKRPDLVESNRNKVHNYLKPPIPSVKTTQEIADTLKDGNQTNHSIPVCKRLVLPWADLPIEPYVLGAWLGDGTSSNGNITGIDKEIFDWIRYYGYEVTNHKNPVSHCIKGLKAQLRELNLLNNKHIPKEYLRSDHTQRWSLLQGLMDTDGYCDHRGQCEISLTDKTLIKDVYELICSLGIKVSIRTGISSINGKDCGEKYRLKFLAEEYAFRILRKRDRQKVKGFRGTHNRRYIVSCEEIQPEVMKCIEVDSPSRLYLAGRSMIPTHNSYLLRWIAVRMLMGWFFTKKLTWVQVMLACEDYPSLKDRQLTKIEREFPKWLGKSYSDHKTYGKCFILEPEYGNGVICFRNLDDPSKYQCFHPDTEILTYEGWRNIREVIVGESVASLNPITREVEYKEVSKTFEYDFDGNMETIFSRGTPSFCVTPNHTIWASTKRCKTLKQYRADELPYTAKIPQWGIWKDFHHVEKDLIVFKSDGNNGKTVSFTMPDWAEFLGWYIGEGSLDPSPRYAIRISQVNESGRKRIMSLLERSGINYHFNDREINFNNKALNGHLARLGKSHDKYIPREVITAPIELAERCLWSLVEADGTWINERNGHFVTASKRLADDISEMALRCGFRPTIDLRHDKHGQNNYGDGHKPRYHVHLLKKNTDTVCGQHRKQVDYKGKVYCVTVPPYHTVLTRYKGRVSWSGQSAEFAAILVDELTKNDYNTFNDLRMRLRWSGLADDETYFIGGTNPGGIGHAYCKAFWIDKIYPDEYRTPTDYTKKFKFVPSKAEDNPHLDSTYWQMLNTLPVHLRAAFRDGSWDTFVGQFFQEWSRQYHVVKPVKVPKDRPVFMTFDWGFGAPFSVGWWWVDDDGRFFRFAEWYGWNGTPNQGLRLADSEIAQGIIKREKSMGFEVESEGIVNPQIIRLCDPTCFNKKPDYKGGGQGTSTAEEFRRQGLMLLPGDPSRALKWRQFHQRLLVEIEDGKLKQSPMMQIYDSCIHFIRTIPNLVVNPNNAEDLDTDGEDHCADEAALLCMARPLKMAGSRWEEEIEQKNRKPKDISEIAHMELMEIRESFDKDEDFLIEEMY